jgi:hypothetical protein
VAAEEVTTIASSPREEVDHFVTAVLNKLVGEESLAELEATAQQPACTAPNVGGEQIAGLATAAGDQSPLCRISSHAIGGGGG